MKEPYTELHPLAPALDRYTPKGLIARTATQCTCPDTGITGDFLFAGESYREKGSRVTPIYPSFMELDIYNQVVGWERVHPACINTEYVYSARVEGIVTSFAKNIRTWASKPLNPSLLS